MTERMLKVKDVVAILGIGESTWWAGVAAKSSHQESN
jgi:predicted DNA-binding transcriptional regulator AlpA